jgi:hypothetical protein
MGDVALCGSFFFSGKCEYLSKIEIGMFFHMAQVDKNSIFQLHYIARLHLLNDARFY